MDEISYRVQGLDVIELPGEQDGMYVILLHGFGANAADLVPLSRLSNKPTWIFPNAPYEVPVSANYSGRAWFPIDLEVIRKALTERDLEYTSDLFSLELAESRQKIEALISERNIPRSKLILGGFSQGAVLAVETALFANDKVAALLIFSGILVNASNWKKRLSLHASTPFFQSHGTEDPIFPLKKAKDLEHLLQEGGLKGKLYSFEGGHGIPPSAIVECKAFWSKFLNIMP
ncbi:MAG: dienelactone hydrolase family protein [Chlamydiales bacterium]